MYNVELQYGSESVLACGHFSCVSVVLSRNQLLYTLIISFFSNTENWQIDNWQIATLIKA